MSWTALPSVTALSLEEAMGQLICPTLFGAELRGKPYDEPHVLEILDQGRWGGYILFHEQAELTRRRVAALQAQSRIPLLIAADMEHGAGQQLHDLTTFPTAMAVGACHRPNLTEVMGAWTAREALTAGVNWILAPVADVTNNPLNPIINIRSFGGTAARVAEHVAAFIKGCQAQGALACAKHFPGHGDTETDSHSRLGQLMASRDRLESLEWVPFKAAIAANVASIMTAHLAVPAWDAPERPATLSPILLTTILRRHLGFKGLIVTDALLMGGITRTMDPNEAAVQAVLAGCDMLLMPPDPLATRGALLAAVHSGRLPEARVYEAAARVLAAKSRLGAASAPEPTLGPIAVSQELARGAITLAKGERPRLSPDTLVVTVNDGGEAAKLEQWTKALRPHGLLKHHTVSSETSEDDWLALIEEAKLADGVLVGVFSPIRVSKDRSLLPSSMVEPLRTLGMRRSLSLVSFSSPFLVAQVPEASTWILAYGATDELIAATVAALAGETDFQGELPVELQVELPPVAGKELPGGVTPPFA